MKTTSYRLSLKEAIFINMNIMIGAGVFVNTIPLSERIGIFSPLSYLIVGILLLPLIFCTMKLIEYYPEGGFYTYAASELSERIGFAAAWSYFIGKMASATLVLSFSTMLIQEIIPPLKHIDRSIVYSIILGMILFINSMGMRLGSIVQKILVYAKFIPIIIIFLIGLFYAGDFNMLPLNIHFNNQLTQLIGTIPMVLYAASGFETACILSLTIQNPTKNASRAIISSYSAVLLIAAIYQLFAYMIFAQSNTKITEYGQLFAAAAHLIPIAELSAIIQFLLFCGLAYSALGSAFGMFYGNIWNFFTLASHKHLPGYAHFTQLNKFGIPVLCIIAEAIISLFFLCISSGKIILLQQCATLALSFTFTTSVLSLYQRYQTENYSLLLPILGLINCLILVSSSLYSLIMTSAYSFILFTCLFLFGIAMLLLSERINGKNESKNE